MTISTKLKGSLIALIATVSFSNVYIFSKLAMKDISLAAFGLLWFGLALLYNMFYYLFFSEKKSLKLLPAKAKRILILIGVSELISISAFFLSIKLTDNPAIVSFLANTSPVFVIIISFIFLNVRYSLLAILGIAVTICGVGLINYNSSGFNWEDLVQLSSLTALIFAMFYGVSLVLARSQVRTLPPALVTVCRSLFLFVAFCLYNVFLFKVPLYTLDAVVYVGVGSVLGPFLGIVLTFISLKYIDASITTLIGTSRSIFIVLGAFIFMNILPGLNQLVGGLLTIMGIVIITLGDIKKHEV